MVFGVKPGMTVQSSFFGLAFNRFEPYVGIDWVAISVDAEGSDVSGSVFIPHIGSKLYLKSRPLERAVIPYFLGDVFFSLASVSIQGFDTEEEDMVKDILQFWGLGLGFGAEFYFTESFSVGGEYGLRYFHDHVDAPEQESHYYYNEVWKGNDRVSKSNVELDQPISSTQVDAVNDEFSFAFKVTYVAISLNFHF